MISVLADAFLKTPYSLKNGIKEGSVADGWPGTTSTISQAGDFALHVSHISGWLSAIFVVCPGFSRAWVRAHGSAVIAPAPAT